jgi:hypothetical protein
MVGAGPLIEGSFLLIVAHLAHHDMRADEATAAALTGGRHRFTREPCGSQAWQPYIIGVMQHLDLTDEEATALVVLLTRIIADDRYPLSPQAQHVREAAPVGSLGQLLGPRSEPRPSSRGNQR